MSRYVDLSNPKIFYNGRDKFGNGIYHIPPDLPTANVIEVQHGKWVMNERGVYECSVCGRVPTEEQKQYDQYCSNCGAKMIE